MKKVISLCAMTMIGLAAICQDTSSQRRNTMDTIRGRNNMQADSSKWNNNTRRDSTGQGSMNNNNQNSTWPNSNDTTPGRQNSLDTSRQRQPMEGSRDSMNRGLSPNTSSDTMNGNSNNNNSGMNRNDSTNRNNNNNSAGNNNTTDSSKSSSGTTGNNASSSSTDSSSTTTTTTSTEKVSDRIAMAEDKIYVIKDGDSTILSKEYKLSSGASVMPDGTVKYPTGKSVNLKNGQFIELPKKSESADADNGTKAKKTTPAKKKTTKKSTTKKATSSSQNQ